MYTKEKYINKSEQEIIEEIQKLGFEPKKFTDEPGYAYKPHKHEETKVLVFLDGEMLIKVEDKEYVCQKGDELIISGNITHSGIVGDKGCTFLWSEKLI